jgi:hypothetical protein
VSVGEVHEIGGRAPSRLDPDDPSGSGVVG